jgi:hypothetical protein
MLQLGQITTPTHNIPLQTKINVNVFIFQQPGDEPVIMPCNVCYQPGFNVGYQYGDIVIVGFIDDNLQYPVILGKLYKPENIKNDDKSGINLQTLSVSSSTKLSGDTEIGEVNYKYLLALKDIVDNNKISILETKLNNLEEKM